MHINSSHKSPALVKADVEETFYDDFECRNFLQGLRWRQRITCPHCDYEFPGDAQKRVDDEDVRYYCENCKKRFTVLTGTFMEGSKSKIVTWFTLIALDFLSAREAAKELGISKNTVIAMRQKLKGVIGLDKEIVDFIRGTYLLWEDLNL